MIVQKHFSVWQNGKAFSDLFDEVLDHCHSQSCFIRLLTNFCLPYEFISNNTLPDTTSRNNFKDYFLFLFIYLFAQMI